MDKLLGSKCKYDSNGKLLNNVGIVCSIWIGIISMSYLCLKLHNAMAYCILEKLNDHPLQPA